MKMQFAQIGAMAHYEFLMHWRRRVLVVATLSLAGICIAAMVISAGAIQDLATNVGVEVDHGGVNIVPYFGLIVYFVMIALFTPIAADAIPLDYHVGIGELIDTLPLRRDSYLIGKMVGMFLSVLFGLLLAMILLGLVARLVLGAYDLALYLQMWLIAALPLAFLNPSLCLLVAARQPSRKRAAMVGGILAVVCFLSFTSSVNANFAGTSLSILDFFNLARPAILRYLTPGTTPAMADPGGILLTMAVGIAELALVGGAVWTWMQWRERRA